MQVYLEIVKLSPAFRASPDQLTVPIRRSLPGQLHCTRTPDEEEEEEEEEEVIVN